jgi:hypothetical protein
MRLDDRTGRLERAVNLVEDGLKKGFMVVRGERDTEHPQSRPVVVRVDRASITPFRPEIERGLTTYNFGLEGANTNSNWERPQVPSLKFQQATGTFGVTGLEGYSHDGGYSVYGFGGFNDEASIEGTW